MRCPDCNKFVSTSYDLEDSEPELTIKELAVHPSPLHPMHDQRFALVEFDLRVVGTCAECGGELVEWTNTFEVTVPLRVLPTGDSAGQPSNAALSELAHVLDDTGTLEVHADDYDTRDPFGFSDVAEPLTFEIECSLYDDERRKRSVGATGTIYAKWHGEVVGAAEFVEKASPSEMDSLV